MISIPSQAKLHGKFLTGGNRTEVIHWTDLFVGMAMTTVAYLLQFIVKRIWFPTRSSSRSSSRKDCCYHLCHYIVVIIGTLGSILSWRGWWNVLDICLPKFIFSGKKPNS